MPVGFDESTVAELGVPLVMTAIRRRSACCKSQERIHIRSCYVAPGG